MSVKGEERFLKSTDARAYRAMVPAIPIHRLLVFHGEAVLFVLAAQLLEKVGNRGKKVAVFSGKDRGEG